MKKQNGDATANGVRVKKDGAEMLPGKVAKVIEF